MYAWHNNSDVLSPFYNLEKCKSCVESVLSIQSVFYLSGVHPVALCTRIFQTYTRDRN
jgi:hypothetical protein